MCVSSFYYIRAVTLTKKKKKKNIEHVSSYMVVTSQQVLFTNLLDNELRKEQFSHLFQHVLHLLF